MRRLAVILTSVCLLAANSALAKGKKDKAKDAEESAVEETAPAAAAEPEKPKTKVNSVAVLDTVPQNVSDAFAALTTQTLSNYATNTLGMDVIAKDDLRKLVSFEQMQQLTGCETGSCSQAANIGDRLGVEKIMTSTLGKIGEKYQLSVVVMDVHTGKVTGRGSRELRSEDEILENAKDLAHFALKNEQRESKGYVRITVPFTGAKIAIDGAPYGVSPLATPVRLLAEKHAIHIEKDGYLPYDTSVVVEVGKELALEAQMVKKSDIKVAGAGFLPWAGATGGLAVVGAGLSFWAYKRAQAICQQYALDSKNCSVPGQEPNKVSLSTLNARKADVDLYGNKVAFYGAIASGVLGATSVVLFSAYFLSGRGSGGDAPEANTTYRVEPTGDGVAIHW